MSGNGNGRKPRLELTWIGKDDRPRLEPRILLPVDEMSHGKGKPGGGSIHDNILIQGDNLLALKALEQQFAGKVQCAFIDPPYNTGSAFEHYDDGVEHSLWLSLIRDRLELISGLLKPSGSVWITIDDYEAHYLKVLCDEVFGRANFLADVAWEKADSPRSDAKYFSARHDHMLVYAKDMAALTFNRIIQDEAPTHYNKRDDAGRLYYLKPLRAMGADGHRARRPSMYFPIDAPDGTTVLPKNPDGSDSRWQWGAEKVSDEAERIEFIKTADGWSVYFRIYFDQTSGRPPETIWPHTEVGSNRTSKKEIKDLFGAEVFDTPKPEALVSRALSIATNPGDLVLDSFAGSGTTGAVAHKMGRRWIMVELGDHATTHIVPRLKKVIDGEDPGGVTETAGWKGGGGFGFYKLAPSLIAEDQFGQKIISKDYNPEMLVEAMCKHMGYTYAPAQDRQLFWQQGFSTERDFIYVTTQSLTHDGLKALWLEVGPNRSLKVCCKAFRARLKEFEDRLTVVKIPQAVLDNCEWGRDDYSLSIAKPPEEADADSDDGSDDEGGNGGEPAPRRRGRPRRTADTEPSSDACAVVAVPVKKAPLKMDGTTRQPSVSKSSSPAAPVAAAPAKPSKPAAPPKAAPSKATAKTKLEKTEKRKAAKSGTKKAKVKPAAKAKSRRKGDASQGTLL